MDFANAMKKLTINVEDIGLLDTGTGSYDVVEVKDGVLQNCDCGEMKAYCYYHGKCYEVYGDKLGKAI